MLATYRGPHSDERVCACALVEVPAHTLSIYIRHVSAEIGWIRNLYAIQDVPTTKLRQWDLQT
jgi:hypothetical protein